MCVMGRDIFTNISNFLQNITYVAAKLQNLKKLFAINMMDHLKNLTKI